MPLCLGIIFGMFFSPGLLPVIILVSLTAAGFTISLFHNSRLTNYVFGFSISLALFITGIILLNNERSRISFLEPEPTTFLSTVSDYPVEKENTYMVTIKLNKIISGGTEQKVMGSIVLYHRKDSLIRSLLPGDIMVLKCTPLEIVNRGNPQEFNYKSFMISKGIRYYAFTGKANILSIEKPPGRSLIHKALIIRERIIKMYEERGIQGERLALVSAITLGQKNLLDPEVKQIFINAGIMHIMAVSGLHAVILSLFIFNLLFFLKGKFNILRIVITIIFLWAFAFVTGLSPSVLRATLMFTFLQAGNLINRRVNGINSVLASAFVLIVIRPSVIVDAGFLLSYAAVIYIIGFYQDFYLKLQFRGWLTDKIWQSAAVTIIAQAGTLPLTITLFNRFPVYFILTNIIIVPLSSLLIVIGCLVPLTYPIVPVSEFLASILDKLTGLTEFLTGTAASLPWSTIDRIGMTTIECILLTVALGLTISFLLKKQPFSLKYPLVAFIIFFIASGIKKVENGKTNELIVYNTPLSYAIGIQTGNTMNLIIGNDTVPAEVLRHVSARGLNINQMGQGENTEFLKCGTNRILITDSLRSLWLSENQFDILILTGKKPFIEKNVSPQVLPQTIILSSEAASGFKIPFSEAGIANKTIRYIRKSGAYIAKL
jgi:competence protein ComEC